MRVDSSYWGPLPKELVDLGLDPASTRVHYMWTKYNFKCYARQDTPYRAIVKTCMLCGTKHLRVSCSRAAQKVLEQGPAPVRCSACNTPEGATARGLLLKEPPPGIQVKKGFGPIFRGLNGKLFGFRRGSNRGWRRSGVLLPCLSPGCTVKRLAKKNVRPGYCEKHKSMRQKMAKQVAQRLAADKLTYTAYSVRGQAFSEAAEFVKDFIPLVPVPVLTLPSPTTAQLDLIWLQMLARIESVYWYEWAPSSNRSLFQQELYEQSRLTLLRETADQITKRGLAVTLRLGDVLESRHENIGLINLDLCCCLKERDLQNITALLTAAIRGRSRVVAFMNFCVRSTGSVADYKTAFRQWKEQWLERGYEVPVLKHISYHGKSTMFLTAMVLDRKTKENT